MVDATGAGSLILFGIELVMSKDIPKRVFAIVASCAFIAFLLGSQLASFLWAKLVPYLAFGIEAHRQSIKVSGGDWRHTLEFSNGLVIHGLKLLPLLGVWVVLCTLFILSLWFFFLHIVARFVRRHDAAFADDVVHFWKFER